MSGANIDFEDERSRHGQLFGREDVLDWLCALLVGERALPRGWILLLGSPGVGKSAIVNRLLERLPGSTPYHFIRRGNEGWDRPEVVVQSLCAQLEQLFPEKASAALPTEMRLGDLLKRISKNHLVPQEERLILVIDGLDEAVSDSDDKNPLPRFLPQWLPQGVVILCASQPMHPHLEWFNQRKDAVRCADLDKANWASSNESACRAFWEHHAPLFKPPLDAAFVDEAVRRAQGNLLHASRLREWLDDQPPERRVAANIPWGLSGFLTQIWIDLRALDRTRFLFVMKGLGFACAAREALPAYLFGELLGGSKLNEGDEFLRVTRPFLLEELASWHNGKPAYRPFHEYFRASIAEEIGDRENRAFHRRVARTLASWPPTEGDAARRLYALRHAVAHRLEGGKVALALRLCANVSYLEAKCGELGVPAIERDFEAAIHALGSNASLDLAAVLAAVIAEASRLRDHPESLPGLLYNRLRCAGWSARRIEQVLRFDGDLPPLRLLHGVRLGPTLLRAFLGHEKPVTACVSTPDGNHLLSASADRILRLWALGTGECVAELKGHKDELTGCAFTPDGKMVVSTSIDATVRLWDLAARCCIATLDNDGRWATAFAVTADGRSLVVGSDNGAITIWDLAARRRLGTLAGHSDYVTACLVTPFGQLVSASRDQSVRVWDLVSGTCVHTLERPASAPAPALRETDEQGWITALTLLPKGKQVLAAAGDGSIYRWDLVSGRCVQHFGAGQGRVDACAVLHEGRHLLCGMADGTLVVWDLAGEQRVLCLPAHAGSVSAAGVTQDGRRVFSASSDRAIRLWEVGGPESLVAQDGHAAPVTACALTPDAKLAVSASEDRTLKIWDMVTGACRGTLTGHADLVTACAFSADGHRVLAGARDGSVRLWLLDVDGVDVAQGHQALVSGCAILPDGRLLTASQDGALWLRSAAELDHPVELGEHRPSVESLAITPDGTVALSISADGTATLWDLVSRRSTQSLRSVAPLLCGTLTPDGQRAVLGRQDGKLEVYDLRTRQLVQVIHAHEQRIFGCAVTPDSERVISASEDGTLRVFSLETGQCLGTLRGTSWFRCVAASRELICAGDQEGNLWMIVDGTVERRASRKRRLKAQEVEQLRKALAKLYRSSSSARVVALDAGLDERLLDLMGSPVDLWQSIIDEALKQGRIDHLVQRALRDYPGDDDLLAIARLLES